MNNDFKSPKDALEVVTNAATSATLKSSSQNQLTSPLSIVSAMPSNRVNAVSNISKSNSLVNVLNFGKKKNLFTKLNNSDHSLNTTVNSVNNKSSSSSTTTTITNHQLNTSVSSFGTVKIKDKKFFNILTSRPKFLDTPKPHQQHIMPPPLCPTRCLLCRRRHRPPRRTNLSRALESVVLVC